MVRAESTKARRRRTDTFRGVGLSPGPRLLFKKGFGLLDDFRSGGSEHFGELEECAEGWALDAALKQAYVGPVEPAFKREFFLRQAARSPDFAERQPKGALWANSGMNVAAALLCQQHHPDMLTTIVPRIIVRIINPVSSAGLHVVGDVCE